MMIYWERPKLLSEDGSPKMDEDTFFEVKRQIIDEYVDRRIKYLSKLDILDNAKDRIEELEELRYYLRNVMLFKREKK